MKFTRKLVVLSAAITALAAFAMPSMASAAVWGPLNTNQLLASSNAAFSSAGLGAGWTCFNQQLNTHVRTPASSTLDVNSTGWGLCVGTGIAAGCVTTFSNTGLPWAATATSSTVVATPWHVQVTFSGGSCPLAGTTINVDGTINGTWTPSTHSLAFNASSGTLTATYMGSPVGTFTVTGTWTNAAQALTLT
jgi:hypothetical protein